MVRAGISRIRLYGAGPIRAPNCLELGFLLWSLEMVGHSDLTSVVAVVFGNNAKISVHQRERMSRRGNHAGEGFAIQHFFEYQGPVRPMSTSLRKDNEGIS
jgi:hypothetical protein